MAPNQNLTGSTSRIKNFIREKISPRATSLYAQLGFANRSRLVQNLQNLQTPNPQLVIESLAAHGVLKSRFQKEISSLNDLQPFMLKGKITESKLNALNQDLEISGINSVDISFYTSASTLAHKLVNGISSAYYSAIHFSENHPTLSQAFLKGTKTAGLILAAGSAYWFLGLPSFTPGLGLGIATLLSVLAAKYSDKFPTAGPLRPVGDVLRFVSRKLAVLFYLTDGFYLGHLIYESNLNIANIFHTLGPEATIGILSGIYLAIRYWTRKNVSDFERSYGSQLDPGQKKHMKKLMSSASYSSIAEIHYLGTRSLLLGAATFYIAGNLGLSFLPALLPLGGIGLTWWLRNKNHFEYSNEKTAKGWDFFKMYTPYLGLAAGLGVSGLISLFENSWIPFLGYTTFWGSFLTLFLTELHGIFHSLNTNFGFIASLKTSSRDLIGEKEKEKSTKELTILGINPNTGLREHSYGVLFNILLARKPGVSYVCMYDLVLAQRQNLNNYRNEMAFLQEVRALQSHIFNILNNGFAINSSNLSQGYQALATNLEEAANFYESDLPRRIENLVISHPDWFDPLASLAEYRRAAFENLYLRAEEFRKKARVLEEMAKKGFISQDHLRKEWENLLKLFDPDYIGLYPMARKNIAGDDRMIRKVENVATGLIMRGLTVYKGWFTESPNDPLPSEEWISGTWTRVPNPRFRYDAQSGSLEGSKFLWVRREEVLTALQANNSAYLSTSNWIASVNNEPQVGAEFAQGSQPITVRINGRTLTIRDYYYTRNNHHAVPPIREVIARNGQALSPNNLASIPDLPANYQIATIHPDIAPTVLFPPAFDYTLMIDKNDIQLHTYLTLPALLERERRNFFVRLMLRYPNPQMSELEVNDPYPGKRINTERGIEIIDANLELKLGERIIPYQVAREAAHVGVNDRVRWQSLHQAEAEVRNNRVVRFSLFYGNTRVDMPPRDWPQYLRWLFDHGQLIDGTHPIEINNFTQLPEREGQMAWLKIQYSDGTIGFVRCPDGKRPTLFNKAGRGYYQVSQANNRIRIYNICIPRGTTIFIPRGWDRDLKQGMRVTKVDFKGDGQMVGRVYRYNANGNPIGTPIQVNLPNYLNQNRPGHLEAVIEIASSPKGNKKLQVVERRLETQGLSEDRSKYIYNISDGGIQQIQNAIPDLSWIREIRIKKNTVTIHYETPDALGQHKSLSLPASCFTDNDGKILLSNPKANMSKEDDLYQSDFYTPETERFAPRIDLYNGRLRLVVHKVRRYEIELDNFKINQGETVKIFPASRELIVTVEGTDEKGNHITREIPLALSEPLEKAKDMIDQELSQVEEGQVQSAIGPQVRLGESNNISSQYPRDPYFYGLALFALARSIEKWGENFAINRGKSVRAYRGIQSGRTHVMPVKLLFNEFADLMETNNEYYRKLSNFAQEIWGPGVSEDTQMEIAYWLKGIKMWVTKEMSAIMNTEKEWGLYNKQNTQRYIYSEVLFNLANLLSMVDICKGRFLGTRPVLMKLSEISEILAGRTWYKVGLAKLVEFSAVPVYLLSLGHVLFYPVDLYYFVGSWLFRTIASSLNYTRHLLSLGYGFVTGFWRNPALELSMLAGYVKGAMQQFLYRNQYGTFVATRSGAGEIIPKENRRLVNAYALATTAGLGVGTAALLAAGLASWLILPLGLVSLPLGLSLLKNGLLEPKWYKKIPKIIGSITTALGSLSLIVLGTPVLFSNTLSLAVIANLVFGAYGLGLLLNARSFMKREIRNRTNPTPQNTATNLSPTQQSTLQQVVATLQNPAPLNYQNLFNSRERLKQLLTEINIMDHSGKITQGEEHPWRMVSFEILELYAKIDTFLLTMAEKDLIHNPNHPDARRALSTIFTESLEPFLIERAIRICRQHRLTFGPGLWGRIRNFFGDLLK